MHVTLHQLRLLLAVAREGSITRAAQRLHLAQPTLSAQLRQLADQVGLPLQERIGRRLSLTAAGEVVVASAARIDQELSDLEQRIAALRGDRGGILRLAVVNTAETFVPRALGDFRRDRPAVQVALVVLNRAAVLQRLAENRDDLYIMSRPPTSPPVETTPFMSNPLVIVAAADHTLAAAQSLALDALNSEEWVFREEGSGTRQASEAFFLANGLNVQPRMVFGSNEAVLQAAAAGLGIAMVSAHALGSSPAARGLAILHVAGTPLESSWQVVVPKGKKLTPLAERFLEYLLDHAAELEGNTVRFR